MIIGGAPVTRQWAEEIRADGFAKDAVSAVHLVQQLVQANRSTLVGTAG